jgi:ABC-type amino acid transport system permease subunit
MLPIAFAALLGVVLGRFFKVATLAPGAVATTVLALVVEWSNGASLLTLLVVVALGAVSLQLGYLVGSMTAHPISTPHRFYSHSQSAGKIAADF